LLANVAKRIRLDYRGIAIVSDFQNITVKYVEFEGLENIDR